MEKQRDIERARADKEAADAIQLRKELKSAKAEISKLQAALTAVREEMGALKMRIRDATDAMFSRGRDWIAALRGSVVARDRLLKAETTVLQREADQRMVGPDSAKLLAELQRQRAKSVA